PPRSPSRPDRPLVPVGDLSQSTPELMPLLREVVEEDAHDRRPHCRSVPRRHDTAGGDVETDSDTGSEGCQTCTPGKSAEPSEQRTAERPDEGVHILGMTGETLGDQR